MGKETGIEWCDSTVNPTMGCDGCELWSAEEKTCYAGILHDRYGGTNKGFAPTFEQVTMFPGRMAKAAAWSDLNGIDRPDKPWLNGRPRHIFVSDMSDALSAAVAFDYLKTEIVDVVSSANGKRHVWMWLTKQAPRMAKFAEWLKEQGVEWPENLWPGTSITRQATVPRIEHLRRVGNQYTTRFVSVEPLLEHVALPLEQLELIDLCIIGGESGANARPCNAYWIQSIITQCQVSGTACFVKQLGSHVVIPQPTGNARADEIAAKYGINLIEQHIKPSDAKGGDMSEWPESLRVREFPNQKGASNA